MYSCGNALKGSGKRKKAHKHMSLSGMHGCGSLSDLTDVRMYLLKSFYDGGILPVFIVFLNGTFPDGGGETALSF